MRAAVKRRRKKSIFLRIALAAFSIYVVITLVQLQLEISEKQKKIEELAATIDLFQKENGELENLNRNYEESLERKAREQGMARPGETIYIEIPGK